MMGRYLGWGLGLGLLAGSLAWWISSPVLRSAVTALASRSSSSGSEPRSVDALDRVAALGRIEPQRGVVSVAGPPRSAVVIEELLVEEGDFVERGQVVAVLAGIGIQRAEVERLQAELANTERELARHHELRRTRVLAESQWRAHELARDVAKARLARAKAELELSTVRAPIDGQALEVHARAGERVGADGIVELGATEAMYVVAEVYETDIGRIQVGQTAEVRSPALPHDLTGSVEKIGLKIGKKDVLSTDPVADADARVVEVEIRLEEPELAAALTNLRVEVLIRP